MRAFVIGNGVSLLETPLDLLKKERTYACNRIWKLWTEHRPKLKWRPTDYIRGEPWNPDGDSAVEDIRVMAKTKARIWLPIGFYRFSARADVAFGREIIPYLPCVGNINAPHGWHFDLGDNICALGTSVNIAMQIAVLQGADEIYLVGCDLGTPAHFYGSEGVNADERSKLAHEMSKASCPVPIYNATIGGNLEVYPRVDLMKVLDE